MSRSNSQAQRERFHFRNQAALWHHAFNTESLGCLGCHYKPLCGGLRAGAGVFSCLTFCRCVSPDKCDNICPKNAAYLVARSREVGGFDLANTPRTPLLQSPLLPLSAPMIYHSYSRLRGARSTAVALSLYELINKTNGCSRFASRSEVVKRFRLTADSQIILSGTDEDPPLERWWSLLDRSAVIRALRALGVALMTTPNFSLFSDVPRTDNLYNMKRIALVWSEIQREGLPCALHVNARAERDWERWAQFVRERPEVQWLSFEFGTGAGTQSRIDWHVEHLCALARSVKRPLRLVARGGVRALSALRSAYTQVLFIDTTSFLKAHKRQQATIRDGELTWAKCPTPLGSPIDDLLDANIKIVSAWSDAKGAAAYPKSLRQLA